MELAYTAEQEAMRAELRGYYDAMLDPDTVAALASGHGVGPVVVADAGAVDVSGELAGEAQDLVGVARRQGELGPQRGARRLRGRGPASCSSRVGKGACGKLPSICVMFTFSPVQYIRKYMWFSMPSLRGSCSVFLMQLCAYSCAPLPIFSDAQ